MVDTRFKEGIDAFERKLLRSACPYRYGSPAHADWSAGWTAGLRARRGDADATSARPHDRLREASPRSDDLDVEDRGALGAPKPW